MFGQCESSSVTTTSPTARAGRSRQFVLSIVRSASRLRPRRVRERGIEGFHQLVAARPTRWIVGWPVPCATAPRM